MKMYVSTYFFLGFYAQTVYRNPRIFYLARVKSENISYIIYEDAKSFFLRVTNAAKSRQQKF